MKTNAAKKALRLASNGWMACSTRPSSLVWVLILACTLIMLSTAISAAIDIQSPGSASGKPSFAEEPTLVTFKFNVDAAATTFPEAKSVDLNRQLHDRIALAPAEAARLENLASNAKLLNAESVLAPFSAGAAETAVIVTLAPTAAARDLSARSASSPNRLASFDQPGAPVFYDLQDPAIRTKLRDSVTQSVSQFIADHQLAGVRITQRFSYQFGFAAQVTPAALEQLLANPTVLQVVEDIVLEPHLRQGIPLMDATAPSSAYDGSGLSIAIVDTGIDTAHPRLGGGGNPIFNDKVIGGYDMGDGDADPRPNSLSGEAHGTACAGIAAGDVGDVGDYIGGVAPGAKLYALKISPGDTGSASSSAMIAAWEWAITHQYDDPDNPILVISTSFGGGQYGSTCDSAVPAMTTAAANAVAAGISIFVSSGNDGYCASIAWPACISYVNSVGAVYDAYFGQVGFCVAANSCATDKRTGYICDYYGQYASFEQTAADKVTVYSNSASFLTLFAPSHNAYTTDIIGSGGYASGEYDDAFGGTSAACPYAAGAAAVLQSAAKAKSGSFLTPSQVTSYLTTYGTMITDSKVTSVQKPRINLASAVDAIPETEPTVTVSASDAIATESGLTTGTLSFSRTGDTSAALSVNYTVTGTAIAGSDYQTLGTSITFAAGSSTATKTVTPLQDSLVEPDETVVITLAAGSGYSIGTPSSATVTITSDDVTSYLVSTAAGANGSISPASRTVAHGATTTFTVTPNAGYSASVTGCGGTLSGDTYTTGPITQACTVSASFSQNSYTVTATAGANGSISPASRTVAQGTTTTFTVTPNAGYSIATVTGCGGTLSGSTYITGPITQACTVSASFSLGNDVITATQAATSYRPGALLTITNQLDDSSGATPLSLLWTPTLPSGWTLESVSGDGAPELSANGNEIVFTGSLSSLPIDFSYQVAVPAGASGEQTISAVVDYQNASMVNPISLSAAPNPLTVQPITYHSADYRETRWQIDSTEANRVLAYWRATSYHVDAAGADGYAPGSGSTDGPLHSADYRDTRWQIDSTEANRVLAYWRAGAYHVDPAGADGYAPGTGTSAAVSAVVETASVDATHNAAGFTPGTMLTISNSFDLTDAGSLWSLLWTPTLPPGWTLESVSGDGAPELSPDGTQILFTGSLADLPIQFSYKVSVPSDSCDPVNLSAEVEYQAGTMVNPEVQRVEPDPLTLAPVDSENLVLEDRTVTGTETQTASGTITAGPSYTITATGDVTFTARQQIRLRPGFRVQTGGRFRAVIDPSLAGQALASVCASQQTAEVSAQTADTAVVAETTDATEALIAIGPQALRLTWSALPASLQAHLLAHDATVRDAQQDAAGDRIVFATEAALLTEDDNDHTDVYHYAVPSDSLELLSLGQDGHAGNAPSDQPRLDGLGQQLIYRSTATNLILGAQNTFAQLYQYDFHLGTTRRLTTTATGEPVAGDNGQALVAGAWVIFRTEAPDLDAFGPGLYRQHLSHDSREPVGLDVWGQQDPNASRPAADASGAEILYQRPEDDGSLHIYLTDAVQAERLSLLSDPELGHLQHCCAAISADGRYFAYREQAEQGEAWLHVCNRTQCDYRRQPWPADSMLREQAPQFNDEGSALLWLNPEQGPGMPEVLHQIENPLLVPLGVR